MNTDNIIRKHAPPLHDATRGVQAHREPLLFTTLLYNIQPVPCGEPCTRYGYPKPTHQCGASGGRGGHARPAEGWRAEPAIAFGELVEPCTTTLTRSVNL